MGCGSSASKESSAPKAKEESKPAAKSATSELQSAHVNNEDIRDKYDLGNVLGSGSFGQVREATLKSAGSSSEIRAVKMIERDNEDGEWSNQAIFVREVGLLQQIKHENIIRYYDFYEDTHFLYVVMELCKGGEVFAKIVELKRFREKDAAGIGQQMLRAMEYIHSVKIAHRDIKAENFMLAETDIHSSIKMIDFGMACKFEEGQVLTELCGSPHYLAPELIGQKYNHRADCWAFGVLLYLIMYGHYPYDAKHPRDIMVKILTEPIRWQTKAKLSKDALDFLKKTLEHDPKKRMSAEEALKHAWMKLANAAENPGAEHENECLTETVRSAHKKVTATRKQVDHKIDQQRNQKLMKIDEDFSRGIRQGKRLGNTPVEEYMSKPEFVRRDNKITTSPSTSTANRRTSLKNLISGHGGDKKVSPAPGGLQAIGEGASQSGNAQVDRKPVRSASLSGVGSAPRRLSYIGSMTSTEEKHLANLYDEKKGQPLPEGVVPGANAGAKPDAGAGSAAATALGEALDAEDKAREVS